MTGRSFLAYGVGMLACLSLSAQTDTKTVTLHETFHISRTCPNSHWYVEKIQDETVTVECDYDEDSE